MSHPLQNFFAKIPLFASLTPDELNELLRAIQPTQLAAGTLLFKEGDQGDAAYVVEQGELSVFLERIDGDVQLTVLGQSAILGEIALLDGRPRTANVKAKTDTTLFRIDKNEFDFLRRNLHPAAYKVVRQIAVTVCERLRDTNQLVHQALAESTKPAGPEDAETSSEGPDDENKAKDGILGKLAFWRNT